MAMKLTELIRKEVIKPTSPTPVHLQTLHLSLFDQFLPLHYVSAIFFYDKTPENETIPEEILSKKLKNSLSETLSRFYPLAGRIEGVSVNCNDEGALFTETRVDMLLSDFLRNPDAVLLEQLIVPSDSLDPGAWPLLHVNVTFFRAGEVAIAVNVPHKICDAHSLMMFVRGWTATAKGYADEVNPKFVSPTFYPPADLSLEFPSVVQPGTKFLRKRFVFGPSKIKELRSRAAGENVTDPTRVEATMALLLKCAIEASRSNVPFAITQPTDVRRRIPSTLLPGNAFGNFFFLPYMIEGSESEMEIHETVTRLRKSKEEVNEMIKENPQETRTITELGETLASAMLSTLCEMSPEMDKYYSVSSWCRMGFYEPDFGWGSPLWVAAGSVGHTGVILMDAKDGEGLEAWVTLPEQDMVVFEHHQELLAFATSNPSVLI